MEVFARKFKTALSFSFSDWKTILTAYWLLVKMQALVFFRGPAVVRKAISPLTLNPLPLRQRWIRLRRTRERGKPCLPAGRGEEGLLRLFRIAWRYQLGKPKCLVTSLAWRAFGGRYGFPVKLRIGVKKKENSLLAHAWCEDSDRFNHDFQILKGLNP